MSATPKWATADKFDSREFVGHTADVDVYRHKELPHFFFVRWGSGEAQECFIQRQELLRKAKPHVKQIQWNDAVLALVSMHCSN